MAKYNPSKIEKKWQNFWQDQKLFDAADQSAKPKKYILVEFPYPSGEGLHMGHVRPYIAGDVTARYNRARGFETMFPFGWDAFGLPAENYAIKNGVLPQISTAKNVANARRQVISWGVSFDWSREVNTTDPDYYKWTQWIFLQLFKAGLAYEAIAPINWCPKDKTGLANEEVIDGRCERCGSVVEKRNMRQWYLRITEYAEKLIAGLKDLDWPAPIKLQQENWIGRSEGAEIDFEITPAGDKSKITVFTTRPDTLFGATYLVLAPEHPLIAELNTAIENWQELQSYVSAAAVKTDIQRSALEKEKTGVELKGIRAINPATGQEIPIWVADYVLASYGTGAIMAVPAHDQRDGEFAKKYKLPARQVILKPNAPIRSYLMGLGQITEIDLKNLGIIIVGKTKDGNLKIEIPEKALPEYENLIIEKMAPGFWNEYISSEIVFIFKHADGKIERLILNPENELYIDQLAAKFNNQEIPKTAGVWRWLAENSWYTELINYPGSGQLVNSGEFSGTSSEQAKKAITEKFGRAKIQYKLRDWLFSRQRYWGEPIPIIHCPKCGVEAVPEQDLPVKLPEVKKYEPTGTGDSPLAAIDSWVNVKCPNCGGDAKRETNTMPQWAGSSWYYLRYCDPKNDQEFAAQDKLKHWLPVDLYFGGMEHTTLHLLYSRFWNLFLYDQGKVPVKEPYSRRQPHGIILAADGEKMSKSRGNVVNPDEIVKEHGADTLRMYELFLGPHDQTVSWNDQGIIGVSRFLERVWNLAHSRLDSQSEDAPKVAVEINKLIKKIGEDLEQTKFNTAIAALMEFINAVGSEDVSKKTIESFLIVLAPFAPHIAEELWSSLGHAQSITFEPWPEFDPAKLQSDTVEYVVQVNGKFRGNVKIPRDAEQQTVEAAAKKLSTVQNAIGTAKLKKVIFVANRLINLVTQ